MVFLLTAMVCSEVYEMLQNDKIDYSRGLKALLEKNNLTLNQFECVDRQPVKLISGICVCFCLGLLCVGLHFVRCIHILWRCVPMIYCILAHLGLVP